jgi:hypothetical protein
LHPSYKVGPGDFAATELPEADVNVVVELPTGGDLLERTQACAPDEWVDAGLEKPDRGDVKGVDLSVVGGEVRSTQSPRQDGDVLGAPGLDDSGAGVD